MIYRDVSGLPTDGICYTLPDNQTIIQYNSDDTFYTFKLFGNTYIQTSAGTDTPVPENSMCVSVDQLPSNYDFAEPIYILMAIVSVVLITYLAYRLILYPFFRKRV